MRAAGKDTGVRVKGCVEGTGTHSMRRAMEGVLEQVGGGRRRRRRRRGSSGATVMLLIVWRRNGTKVATILAMVIGFMRAWLSS